MKYGLYTLSRHEIEKYEDQLPGYVVANSGRKGVFMLGATDKDMRIVGLTQFYVRMLPREGAIADIVYVYVMDDSRGHGVASRMIAEVHKIMKKSGGEKCLTLLKKKQREQQLFERNGYLFMKSESDSIGYLEEVHEDITPARTQQGVYYIGR